MIKWVTPSLGVAQDWHNGATNIDLATTAVQEGGTVIVESDEAAAQVLSNLGLLTPEIEDRLHFANTGEVLGV